MCCEVGYEFLLLSFVYHLRTYYMRDTVLGVLEAMKDSQAAYHLIEKKENTFIENLSYEVTSK